MLPIHSSIFAAIQPTKTNAIKQMIQPLFAILLGSTLF